MSARSNVTGMVADDRPAPRRGFPVPPPVLALAAVVAQRKLGHRHPASTPRRTAAALVGLAAVTLAGSANAAFHHRGTTHNPLTLGTSTTLVTEGPFRITRNPMYVGLTGLLTAHSLWRGSLAGLLPATAFAVTIDRLQVPSEELALAGLFGDDYRAYRAAVPRWLGPVGRG